MTLRRKKSYWQQDIKRREYGTAAAKGILLLGGITWLFYDQILMGLLLIPFLVYYLHLCKDDLLKKKKEIFQLQFKESMLALSAALNVGYSVENAMKEVVKDLNSIYPKDARIIKEYTYMVHQLNMNLPAEQVLQEFADRVGQEDVESFVAVFVTAKKSGGDSVAIIRNTVKIICDKIEVKREIEILMAAKELEFKVMTMIPLGIICYMRFSFPEFMGVLYGSIAGIIVMSVSLAVYGAAYRLGRKIVEIEV